MTSKDLLEKLKQNPIPSACGVILLLSGLLFAWRYGTIGELQVRFDLVSRDGSRMEKNVVNSPGIKRDVESAKKMVSTIQSRLVSKNELARNLQYFYRYESECGVSITDLRQVEANKDATSRSARMKAAREAYGRIPFLVSVTGEYSKVLLFLRKLETGPCFYHLETLDFQRSSDVTKPSVSLSLKLELLSEK